MKRHSEGSMKRGALYLGKIVIWGKWKERFGDSLNLNLERIALARSKRFVSTQTKILRQLHFLESDLNLIWNSRNSQRALYKFKGFPCFLRSLSSYKKADLFASLLSGGNFWKRELSEDALWFRCWGAPFNRSFQFRNLSSFHIDIATSSLHQSFIFELSKWWSQDLHARRRLSAFSLVPWFCWWCQSKQLGYLCKSYELICFIYP